MLNYTRSLPDTYRIQVAVLAVLLLGSVPTLATDAPSCDDIKQETQRRLKAAEHPANQVKIAEQMLAGLDQSCAYLDDDGRRGVYDALAQILPLQESSTGNSADATPARTPEQDAIARQEERQRMRDEADARKRKRDAEKARRRKLAELPTHPILAAPPTLKFTHQEVLARTDQKYGIKLHDFELAGGTLRLLYSTYPSREQYAQGDQSQRAYLLRRSAGDGGEVLIADIEGTITGALQRRADDIFLLLAMQSGSGGGLQLWSSEGKGLLRQLALPPLPGLTADRAAAAFVQPTGRGELVFQTGTSQRGKGSTLYWATVTADGTVSSSGEIKSSTDTEITMDPPPYSRTGPYAALLRYLAQSETGLESRYTVKPMSVGGHTIDAVVGGEVRLARFDDTGEIAWESAALERQIQWQNLDKIPQEDYLRLGSELTQAMGEKEQEAGTTFNVVRASGVGNNRSSQIVALRDGYTALLRNQYSNPEKKPVRGSWLRDLTEAGTASDTYLHPFEKQLDTRFELLSATGTGNVVVAGNNALVVLDSKREPIAYARYETPKGVTLAALIASEKEAWLIGAMPTGKGQRALWLGRVALTM